MWFGVGSGCKFRAILKAIFINNIQYHLALYGIRKMDYSYFINSADKFSAKKLPSPKSSGVKFKDVTYLDDLREDIRDYKPTTTDEFQELYENCFNSIYDYEVEIEPFEDVVLANRQKFLGTNNWIKKYWHDLFEIVEGVDSGDIEINYDWLVVDELLAKAMIKSGVAEQKLELEYEYDDWSNSLQGYKLPELKEIAKPLGIKLSQRKDALIHDLVTSEESTPGTLPLPTVIRALPKLETTLLELQKNYINEFSNTLDGFEYPRAFEAAVWSAISAEHGGLIQTLADEKLVGFDDLNVAIPEMTEQELLAAEKLVKDMGIEFTVSINSSEDEQSKDERIEDYFDGGVTKKIGKSTVLIFDYEDSKGNISNREFRLDKINETGDSTYLQGFCYMRNAARTFRLDRVRGQIVIKETGELIDKNNIFDLTGIKTPKTKAESSKLETQIAKRIQPSNPPTTELNSPIKGNGIGWKIAGWIFGLLFLLSSIGGILQGEWLTAAFVALAGAIIIPPINNALAKKLNEKGLIQRFTIAKGFGGWFTLSIIASLLADK